MKVIILSRNRKYLLFIVIFVFFVVLLKSLLFSSPFSFAHFKKEANILTKEIDNQIKTLDQSDEKVAYLTFDDGPHPKVTPKVLDILKETNTKATFFLIGRQVSLYPEVVKRTYEEGHYLANHSYWHNNKKLYMSSSSFIKEITRTDEEIGKAIGIENYSSHLFRFPNRLYVPMLPFSKKASSKTSFQNGLYLSRLDLFKS